MSSYLYFFCGRPDGIGDEEIATRQPGLVRGVSFVFLVFDSEIAAGQQEKCSSETISWREGDHRLVRSDFT